MVRLPRATPPHPKGDERAGLFLDWEGREWGQGSGPGHLEHRGPVWAQQLSYSALRTGAGRVSLSRRRKGSRKSPEHTLKQTWAPASQYTAERQAGSARPEQRSLPQPTRLSEEVGNHKEQLRGHTALSMLSPSPYLRQPPWAPPPWPEHPGSAECP